MCSREGLLDLENEKYVVSYLGRAQLLSCACYFGVSVHRGQTPAVQPGAHLSPASEPAEQSRGRASQAELSLLGTAGRPEREMRWERRAGARLQGVLKAVGGVWVLF